MQHKVNQGTRDGAAVYSPLVLKAYDLWVLGFSNRYAWQCPTRSVLLPFFQQHLSANHLDVGVGTGYYLAHSSFSAKQKIALLDLNRNSLAAASAPIAHLLPLLIQEDILNPNGALGNQKFDSISLFYLLHCLPGNIREKAAQAFELLHQHLTVGGTLYGATILGDHVAHNWLGRRLMRLYNKKGIFGNHDDTLSDLESALTRYFTKVNVRQHGKVALFSAELAN
ncbi:methyltransferase [Undibacterium sp. Di27W]|uniref:methyltransferase n=1 Tax=Undibacterium sp. Di27W TaxID=3413036 RepID=UPI003BF21F08